MGRKNRKRIPRRGGHEIKESDSDGDDEDLLNAHELEKEQARLDMILRIRCQMLEYREQMALPICEHLTVDFMLDFANWLQDTQTA
jgi:hypothetical protein